VVGGGRWGKGGTKGKRGTCSYIPEGVVRTPGLFPKKKKKKGKKDTVASGRVWQPGEAKGDAKKRVQKRDGSLSRGL